MWQTLGLLGFLAILCFGMGDAIFSSQEQARKLISSRTMGIEAVAKQKIRREKQKEVFVRNAGLASSGVLQDMKKPATRMEKEAPTAEAARETAAAPSPIQNALAAANAVDSSEVAQAAGGELAGSVESGEMEETVLEEIEILSAQ